MNFYKFTLKNLMIDGLIIGLWVVTFLQLKYVPPAYSKALGIFWIMPMFGIVLVRS